MIDEQLRDNVERLLQGSAQAPSPEFVARLDRLLHPSAPTEPRRGLLLFLRVATSVAAVLCVALLIGRSDSRRIVPPVEKAPEPRREAAAYVQDAVIGSIVAKDEDGRAVGELGLREHLVSVEILDGVAKTTVEENFENHTDRRLEGTFQFPLPPDASISRLALEVNGKIEEGTCLERERARQVFESIVSRMKDPALLEWQAGGFFKCRIFPIEPRATKRVIIAYTQALPYFRGKMTYVYPLASEKTRTHPPGEVRIDVQARFSGALAKIESPSHRLDVRRKNGNEASISFRAAHYRPNNDFVVTLEPVDEEVRVVSHKVDGEDGYFACFVTPRGAVERAAGLHTFVLDASASVSGPRLDVAKLLVRAMIERRIEGDRFQILAHNVEVESSGDVDLRAANDFMDRIRPIGGSDVLQALRAASVEGEVLYIGKGLPTFGETDASRILDAVKGRRIRTIAVGSDANLGLLEKLGGLMLVSPNDDVPKRVAEIAATLGSPALSGFRLEGGAAVYDVVGLRDIFHGERLMVAGRYRGASTKLVITGSGYRREVDVAFPPKEEANNYVRRLWAQRKVSDLLAQGAAKQAEVTELGVKHQIMTPYTSFLVLENEQMWKDHQLRREVQKQDHLLVKRGDDEKKRPAEAEAAAQDSVTKREVLRKMAHLLELSYMAFEQKRYDRCIKLCDDILIIDPHYTVARELKEDSEKTRHKEEYYDTLARKVEQWKKLTDDDVEPVIPGSQTVRFPSREEWAEISKRITGSVIKTEGGAADAEPGFTSQERVALEEARIRRDLIEEDRARDDFKLQMDQRRETELLFGQAQMYFEQEQFARSAEVCEKILRVNPNLTSVAEMRNVAQRSQHMKMSSGQLKGYVEEWKRTFEEIELNASVQGDALQFPSGEEWKELIGKRSGKSLIEPGAPIADALPILADLPMLGHLFENPTDPDIVAIHRKLSTMKVDLAFENTKLEDVLAYLRDFSGLNILLDAAVRDKVDPDKPVTIKLTDRPLEENLRRVIAPFGLDYTITPENVVLLTDPWKAHVARRQPKGLSELPEEDTDEDRTIIDKLHSIRVTIDMQNVPLTIIVDYIREISGLNIHIAGIDNPESEFVTFKVQDMVLDGALRLLLQPRAKTYLVRNGVVLICPVVTVRSMGDDDREVILEGKGLEPRQLLVVTRDSKFVAVVQVLDRANRGRAAARLMLSVGRILPGDHVQGVANLARYLAALPRDVKLEMASRAGQHAIRAKMGLKE